VFPGEVGFNRTQTQWTPDDAVVTACLLVARDHFAPSILEIESDGQYDGRYWAAGRALYARVLGRTPKNLGGTGLLATLTRWTGPWSALLQPLLLAGLACFLFARRGCGGGPSWTTFYLFWFLGPMLISIVTSFPAILLAVPAALLARRWLPDPYLAVKHARQIRALKAD